MNQTFLQPFANCNLGSGLAVGVSMEASKNWKADETWTAPLLFSVSKVTLLGTQPVNLAVAAGPMVAAPRPAPVGGSEWRPHACFRTDANRMEIQRRCEALSRQLNQRESFVIRRRARLCRRNRSRA